MKKERLLKFLPRLGLAVVIIFGCLALTLLVPEYAQIWTQYGGWLVMGLLLMAFIFPTGKEIIGDMQAKLPLSKVIINISFSYLIIALFILCAFIMVLMIKVEPSPEKISEIIAKNVSLFDYAESAYPWMLYALGVILVGLLGYKVHRPKMSGAVETLIPHRYLGAFGASVIDFTAFSGFYAWLLVTLALSAIMISKLIAYLLGHTLDFGINITMMGINFTLAYLPFSPLWKSAIHKVQNSRLNYAMTLLVCLVGLGFFVAVMYGILNIFLEVFAEYYRPFHAALPTTPLEPLAEWDFPLFLWGFSLVSFIVIAGWWSQYVQGYSVRAALLILLLPYICGWLIVKAAILSGWLNLTTFTMLIQWLAVPPVGYILGILASIILILAVARENNFLTGFFWVAPNLTGRKLSRWRKIFLNTANVVVFSMLLCLSLGIYFIKTMLLLMAIMASLSLILAITSFIKYSCLSIYRR